MISVFCSSQDTAYEIRHGKPNIGDVFFHLELEYTFKAMCEDNRNNIYFKRKGNKNYVEIINGCAITWRNWIDLSACQSEMNYNRGIEMKVKGISLGEVACKIKALVWHAVYGNSLCGD